MPCLLTFPMHCRHPCFYVSTLTHMHLNKACCRHALTVYHASYCTSVHAQLACRLTFSYTADIPYFSHFNADTYICTRMELNSCRRLSKQCIQHQLLPLLACKTLYQTPMEMLALPQLSEQSIPLTCCH